MDIKTILKERRQELGLTMKEVADACGVSEATVSRWESGEIANMRRSKISLLAKVLKISPAVLIDDEDKPDYSHIKNVVPVPKTKEIPIIGGIACGTPILAEQNIDGQVKIPEFVQADFALRCNGDSMIGAHIRDGDLVCIRIQPDVDDGQIAAVLIGEDATLKRVYHRPDGVMLVAENPSFAPMVYIGEECEDIRILGKAMTCISKVR